MPVVCVVLYLLITRVLLVCSCSDGIDRVAIAGVSVVVVVARVIAWTALESHLTIRPEQLPCIGHYAQPFHPMQSVTYGRVYKEASRKQTSVNVKGFVR